MLKERVITKIVDIIPKMIINLIKNMTPKINSPRRVFKPTKLQINEKQNDNFLMDPEMERNKVELHYFQMKSSYRICSFQVAPNYFKILKLLKNFINIVLDYCYFYSPKLFLKEYCAEIPSFIELNSKNDLKLYLLKFHKISDGLNNLKLLQATIDFPT